MKKYTDPKMTVKSFDRENIVMQSGTQTTAVQQATAAAANIENNAKTFTVTW